MHERCSRHSEVAESRSLSEHCCVAGPGRTGAPLQAMRTAESANPPWRGRNPKDGAGEQEPMALAQDALWQSAVGADLLTALDGRAQWQALRATHPELLTGFLRHAVATVPYFQRLCQAGRLSPQPRLEDFLPVTRSDVAHDPWQFVSQALRGEECERFFTKTSGITAVPLTVLYDPAGWYELNHESYASLPAALLSRNMTLAEGELGVLQVTNEVTKPECSVIILSLDGAVFLRRAIGRDAGEDRMLVEALHQTDVPILYGKPNYLLDLADLVEAHGAAGGRPRVGLILVTGANLYADHRKRLASVFGCGVINGYSSAEGGVVALEGACHAGLHVRPPRVVEIRSAAGRLSRRGTGELVVTNPANWAMPFVRYRTGDWGTVVQRECGCGFRGTTIVRLAGRDVPAFEGPRGLVPTAELDEVLVPAGVKDFAITRRAASRYEVAWVPRLDGAADRQVVACLTRSLRRRLGPVAIEAHCVASVTGKGGKARRYINHETGRNRETGPSVWARTRGGARPWRCTERLMAPTELLAAAIAPSATLLAGTSGDGRIGVAAVRDGHLGWRTQGHVGLVQQLCFDATERGLYLAGEGRLCRWSVEAGAPTVIVPVAGAIASLAASPAGDLLGVGHADSTLALWAADLKACYLKVRYASGPIRSIAFPPDGEYVAISTHLGHIVFVDVSTGSELWRIAAEGFAARQLRYSPAAKLLAAAGQDGSVRVWHAPSASECLRLSPQSGRSAALAFSPKGDCLICANASGTASLWSVPEGERLGRLSVGPRPLSIALSHGGTCLSIGGRHGCASEYRQQRRSTARNLSEAPPGLRYAVAQT